MRPIPPLGPDSAPAPAPIPASAMHGPTHAVSAIRFLRAAIRNAPWIAIAATTHLVGIAVLSVVYVRSHDSTDETDTRSAARFVERLPDVPPPPLVAPEPVPRDKVPAATAGEEGPVNVDEVVVSGEDPGRRGEVTIETDPDEEPGIYNADPEARPDLRSGASGGTPIGVGRIGHHGTGTPSAFVSRIPGEGGRGRGGLGQSGRGGVGGPRRGNDTDAAVMAALQWLTKHQSSDGRWDCDGFDTHCKANRCDGAGDASYDVGVTGLSLLAYLGAGETHRSGSCKETVRKALRYLRDSQDTEGCFGERTSQHFLYNHACASLAMTEAFGMTGTASLREPARRGVAFVLKARNPYLAWRYAVPADGDNDTSVTGWMVMALKSAQMSGIEIEGAALRDAIAWVERMTEPEFGRTGYRQRGTGPARTETAAARFPASKSESLTAVGMTTRIFGGRDAKDDSMIGRGADLLVRCLPRWDADQGTIDFYYWYYGSLAMFQVGGERWRRWNDAMKTALLDHQRLEKDRDEYGSWDPVDPWSAEGGRVYATAINCLTMEVYYRYPNLFGVK